jgi:hypothetical protein
MRKSSTYNEPMSGTSASSKYGIRADEEKVMKEIVR